MGGVGKATFFNWAGGASPQQWPPRKGRTTSSSILWAGYVSPRRQPPIGWSRAQGRMLRARVRWMRFHRVFPRRWGHGWINKRRRLPASGLSEPHVSCRYFFDNNMFCCPAVSVLAPPRGDHTHVGGGSGPQTYAASVCPRV